MLRITTQMTGRPGAPYFSTQFTAGTEQAHAAEAAEAFHDFWEDIAGYITTGLSMQVLPEVDVVDPATGLITNTHAVSVAAVPSTGNAALPAATQGLVRLRSNTFQAGRRVQGRIFIPALANDAQLTGIPSTGFLTDTANAAELVRTTLEPGDNDWVVWSRAAGIVAPITAVSVWTQFAVLRSRRD